MNPAVNTGNLKSLTDALTHVVAQLDRSHSSLVDAVVSLPWTSLDESFVQTYTRFVRALLTTRVEFVQAVLDKIIRGFRFREISFESPHVLIS